MHKSLFVLVLSVILSSGLHAQAWAQKWDWPLLPIHQSYNVGDTSPDDTEVGGVGHYWKYPDPTEAAVLPTTTTATKPKESEPAKASTNP